MSETPMTANVRGRCVCGAGLAHETAADCSADRLRRFLAPSQRPLTAEEFNSRHPVGTRVVAYPGTRGESGITTHTRTPAWTLGHGAAVVAVEGVVGGIALTHIDVIAGEDR